MGGDLVHHIQQQVAALAAELRTIKRHEHRLRSAQQRQWRLHGEALHVVLIVSVMAHGASEPLVPYVRGVGRRSQWPEKSDDEIGDLIVACFVAADVQDIVDLSDECAPSDPDAMRAALSILREWRVSLWTEAHNRQRGVAVPTSTVLAEFEKERLLMAAEVRPRPMGTSAEPAARKRAQRWRLKWGGRFAKIKAREVVPLPLLREKAARCRRREGHEWGGVSGRGMTKRRLGTRPASRPKPNNINSCGNASLRK